MILTTVHVFILYITLLIIKYRSILHKISSNYLKKKCSGNEVVQKINIWESVWFTMTKYLRLHNNKSIK